MFACQNFLHQSCRKFYKEQKLFYVHLMKMKTSSSKVTHKADLGLFPTLRKFFEVRGRSSLLDRFSKLHIFQTRPIWLLLQLTML